MAKINTYPEVRFASFTDYWVEQELGEVAKFNPKHELPDVFNYVDLESVVGTEMISYRKEYKISAPSRAQRLAEKGDVFYQTVRPYQKNNLLFDRKDKDFVFSTGYAQLRPIIESSFLFTLIQKEKFVKIVLNNCTGTSYPAINSTVLASIKQYFPKSKDEQKLIGNFFENIDNLISEHHQKHAKLKSLNQAVLDKMFPKQGQVIPEIRFKGFEGDWVEYEVGEIFTVTRGNVLATSKISKSKNDVMQYPVYSSQTANNGLLGYYDEYLFENAITWTTDGANAGTVNYRKEKFYSTNVNGVLLSDEGFANKMVAEAINKLTSKYVLRVGNPKLMNNVMSQIKIILPSSIEEQSLISKKLILIEDVLFQHKHQIIKLNNIKKAFLAKMFI